MPAAESEIVRWIEIPVLGATRLEATATAPFPGAEVRLTTEEPSRLLIHALGPYFTAVGPDGQVELVESPAGLEEGRTASGLEAPWLDEPQIVLAYQPSVTMTATTEIAGFNPIADQVYISLAKGREAHDLFRPHLTFHVIGADRWPASQDVVILRRAPLRVTLELALASDLLSRIWPNPEAGLDWRNPETLTVLRSPRVLDALAASKQRLVGRGIRRGGLTLGFSKDEFAVLFNTAGQDRTLWAPFA